MWAAFTKGEDRPWGAGGERWSLPWHGEAAARAGPLALPLAQPRCFAEAT